MVEQGHFAELDNILRLTTRGYVSVYSLQSLLVIWLTTTTFRSEDGDEEDIPDQPQGQSALAQIEKTPVNEKMQTFIFSATMSKDLQQNLRKRHKARRRSGQTASSLGERSLNYL
jgi:ATP-dependent RNA helicase DDX24/MAK5